MKAPPYAKHVLARRQVAGHKLLLFAGPKAWPAAKWYRENGSDCEGRASHVLVLPHDQTQRATMFNWPVRRAGVIVVSTCGNDAELMPLFDALQRDGARTIELYACDSTIGATELEWQLLCIHWGHPFAPPAPAPIAQAEAA